MSYIVRFLEFVFKCLKEALSYIRYLPARLVSFFTTFVVTVSGAVSFILNRSSDVAQGFDYATSAVQSAGSYVEGNQIFLLLSHVFSLDVALQYLVSVFGVFAGLMMIGICSLLSYALVFLVFPLIFNLVTRLISLLSGGFVKP